MQNNSKIVLRFVEEVLNQGNIDSTGQFFWEDMVEQVPFPGQAPGVEGLKDVLRGMRAAFPDMHWSVEEQMAEGDRVLTRFGWTGTHRDEFLGVPATGRPVKVWGTVIDRFQDGKIKDSRLLMDNARIDDAARRVSPARGMTSKPPSRYDFLLWKIFMMPSPMRVEHRKSSGRCPDDVRA